jgi:surface antigen
MWDESTVPRVYFDQPYSECVPFARRVSGVEIYGDAVTWWGQAEGRYPKSYLPLEGSVLVLRGYAGSGRGHVAVVKSIQSERMIRVDQANWLNSGEASYDVPVIDVSAANDWSEVRVWHVPGGHWGGRIYLSDGFVHPIANPSPVIS